MKKRVAPSEYGTLLSYVYYIGAMHTGLDYIQCAYIHS